MIDEKYVEQTPKYVEQTPKKKGHKVLWIFAISMVALLMLVIGLVAVSSGSNNNANTPQSAQSTQQSAQKKTPNAQVKPMSTEQQLQDIAKQSGIVGKMDVADSSYNPDGKVFVVYDDIGDGTIGGNDALAKMDIFSIQKATWTSKVAGQVSEVKVFVSMNLVDSYGKNINSNVASATLTKDNAHQFNWGNMTQDMAWGDYDNTWLHPGDGWK